MSGEKDEVAVHTLLSREIRPIYNWHEWLSRWQAAEDFQWMESLLHVGFSIPLERRQYGEREYDSVDRVIFYFAIADGWCNGYLLELPTDQGTVYDVGHDSNWNVIRKKPRELRQQLARKAFDMLCLHFFKTELLGGGRYGDRFNEDWEKVIVSDRLFSVIQNFFKVEKGKFDDDVSIRNLSRVRGERSHNEQQAVAFLLNLANFIWKWKEPDTHHLYYRSDKEKEDTDKRLAETRAQVDAAKPWMVEILVALDRIDVLRGWILELDKPCLTKLKEIALRTKLSTYRYPVAKDRLVATLEEACYVGSPAAWFLKEHELKTGEHERLEEIREAERKRAEADRKITELTAKK